MDNILELSGCYFACKGKGKDVDLYSASTCLQVSSNITETERPGRI